MNVFQQFDFFQLQKKIWAQCEEKLEKSIEALFRDGTFMKVITSNMNMNLDMQKMVHKQVNMVLKNFAIPTEESLSRAYKAIHDLETKTLDLEEQIDALQEKIEELELANETKKSTNKMKEFGQKAV